MIRAAQRRTGLREWGDASFRTGLEQLTAALREQAALSPIGRIAAYLNILDHLCVRLRLIDYRAARPDVARQQITAPLFILGLPRTGTTILHELIAQDPAFRAPASWEVTRPLPPPTARDYDSDRRIGQVDRVLGLLEKLAPGFRRIHAVGARLPQECVYILASAFISEQFAYLYHIPAYRNWALDQDMTAPYHWHQRTSCSTCRSIAAASAGCQHPLTWPAWGACSPRYPDATIVRTHRRPLDAMASFSSLTYTLRSGFSKSYRSGWPTATANSEHFVKSCGGGMEARRSSRAGQFIDIAWTRSATTR
ncbi:MAG: sulfotransferase [Halioglobus sp.]